MYYEVDCFDDIRNPYFSLDTHSSMSHVRRKKNDKHNLYELSGKSEESHGAWKGEKEASDGRLRHRF